MTAALIIFGIPVLCALLAANKKFLKAWLFFFSSVIGFYTAISLLSTTLPLAEDLLGKNSLGVLPAALTGAGLLITLALVLLLSLILFGKEVPFPEKFTCPLKFVLGYCGSLLLIVLLVFGVAPFIITPAPDMTSDLLRISSDITQKTMSFCQKDITEHQKLWLRCKPGYLTKNIDDAVPEAGAGKMSLPQEGKSSVDPMTK